MQLGDHRCDDEPSLMTDVAGYMSLRTASSLSLDEKFMLSGRYLVMTAEARPPATPMMIDPKKTMTNCAGTDPKSTMRELECV